MSAPNLQKFESAEKRDPSKSTPHLIPYPEIYFPVSISVLPLPSAFFTETEGEVELEKQG